MYLIERVTSFKGMLYRKQKSVWISEIFSTVEEVISV